MIPLNLTLKNFLSYREASLDFRGLHTACICGANGAGKSSLLEAITWVIWGKSRAPSEDDIIYLGAENVRVDFEFICNHNTYRIIRSRQRGKTTALDFQVASSQGFRSLNAKGIKTTQEEIVRALKLDYDTFVNSAYLRQGKADEFMQHPPSQRKQILAELLKLSQYEKLADQAKDMSKQYKGKAEQLEENNKRLAQYLEQKIAIATQKDQLEKDLKDLQKQQQQDQETLQEIQTLENQRQNLQQQLTWQQNQYKNLDQECDRLSQEENELKVKQQELQHLINQEEEITQSYQNLLNLQREEETLSDKFQAYQQIQQQKQHLDKELLRQKNELTLDLQKSKTRLETLEQQEQEIRQTLNQSQEVENGLEKLRECRQHLSELDQLQHQVVPLLQRQDKIKIEIERGKSKLSVKLEQLREEETDLLSQLDKIPQIRQEVLSVYAQIETLEKKQVYQQRVQEKGTERKTKQQQLEDHKPIFEKQLDELSKKLELLSNPEAICPLCEQVLNDHHRDHVVKKTQTQQQEIKEQIWQSDEQIILYKRELEKLRLEYKQLSDELKPLSSLQQQFGQLEAQLEASGDMKLKLNQIKKEIFELEKTLNRGDFDPQLKAELAGIEQQLKDLNYDEQTHALVRSKEKQLRWAEIKQANLQDANRRQNRINQEKPVLLAKIKELEQDIENLSKTSPIQQQINQLENQLIELNYDGNYHQKLQVTLRQKQADQFRYQQLQQAKENYPQLEEKMVTVKSRLKAQEELKTNLQEDIKTTLKQVESLADHRLTLQNLDPKIQQQRQKLDELLAKKGGLEQTLIQMETFKEDHEKTQERLKEVKKKIRIYQALTEAFGKNGIQTLMIENILPQLEAETNHILSRLTGHQLHVQFLTQKSGKSNRKKQTAKMIDTLEILISDGNKTRPYETYSGGEAFRINFAIRLALARLLAQRSGTSLQLLIVDEGFGTQDPDGCERLIAAINAIASDFTCILTVTHMTQFKEAFQHRIEVRKTNQGSQLVVNG